MKEVTKIINTENIGPLQIAHPEWVVISGIYYLLCVCSVTSVCPMYSRLDTLLVLVKEEKGIEPWMNRKVNRKP